MEETKLGRDDEISFHHHPQAKARSSYSQSQRIYLDQLEHGEYSTYAGGLLFTPLLERYNFLPMIKRVIDIETHEGYSLDEPGLTITGYI